MRRKPFCVEHQDAQSRVSAKGNCEVDRPVQDLGNFALKTIYGWVTEKELIRYTRDFDREAEAVGTLIKLNERRRAKAGP